MPNSITVEASAITYRNPHPNLRSQVAYHPSLVQLGVTEFLSTFDLGQAVESLDYHTVQARSSDAGESWAVEGPLISNLPPQTTHTVRISRLQDGSLVGFGCFSHRVDPDQGVINRETLGYVPMDLFLIRSHDEGRSWTQPVEFEPPLIGPSWEICHSVVELADGRWLIPLSTWRGWDGDHPSGDQAVVFISDDRGESWPRYGCTFDGRSTGALHWEQSVAPLQDGRLIAVSWVYDSKVGRSRPSQYSLSSDRGENFSAPMETGFLGQTCKTIQLRDGRLLFVYRRDDQPGLWGTLCRLQGDGLVHLELQPLWQGAESGMIGAGKSADELSGLKFGYPNLQQISDDRVMILFWCQEDCITGIRQIRLKIA